MKVRFQADADLNQILLKATLRREPGIDFQTAHAARLVALSDNQVLAIAAAEGRVLVTHDRKTMPETVRRVYRDAGERRSDCCSTESRRQRRSRRYRSDLGRKRIRGMDKPNTNSSPMTRLRLQTESISTRLLFLENEWKT